MDGVEICSKLRSENIHTPILMLTAKGQVEDKVKGLNSELMITSLNLLLLRVVGPD